MTDQTTDDSVICRVRTSVQELAEKMESSAIFAIQADVVANFLKQCQASQHKLRILPVILFQFIKNIREWSCAPVKLYETYAKKCTKSVWLKLHEVSKECAEWMLKRLPNEDLNWCCKNCDPLIVIHKDVHRMTADFIYLNVYKIDKIFYTYSESDGFRIKCSDCRCLLDRGYIDQFIKFDENSVYFEAE